MDKLFKELRRRNVFRVAGVYGVVGWLLAQAAVVMETALGFPSWFDGVVVGLLLIGFPVALILAWAFEMTPDGMKRTADVPQGESITSKTGRQLDIAILAGLALVAVIVIADRVMPKSPAPATEVAQAAAPEREAAAPDARSAASIAVLPFADLSPQKDQEYFSDGIAEEILNVLARVDGLKVASRTSSFAFKERTGLSTPAIAQELSVAHVLEGSVRKSGDTVRITAQLISAGEDKHLWSQTFDRTLTVENLFKIQDEIAKTIVEELGTKMSLGRAETIRFAAAADTQNLDAYDAYLTGRDLFSSRGDRNLLTIIAQFEKAVRLDPNFARGWEALAAAYSVAPGYNIEDDRDFLGLAREAAERALALNDKLAIPYGVMGNLASVEDPPQYHRALELMDQAIALDPKEATLWNWRGQIYTELGFFERGKQDLLQALALDPKDIVANYWLMNTYLNMGKPELALERVDKGEPNESVRVRLVLAMMAKGKGDEVKGVFPQSPDPSVVFDETLFTRTVTDPNADLDAAYETFRDFLATIGFPRDEPAFNDWLYTFKRYDEIHAEKIALGSNVIWYRYHPDFIHSPERKRLIREVGFESYWREYGFPPQCRPIGDDDFECD